MAAAPPGGVTAASLQLLDGVDRFNNRMEIDYDLTEPLLLPSRFAILTTLPRRISIFGPGRFLYSA